MPLVYPACLLLLQYLVITFLPAISAPAAYIAMILAPLFAAVIVIRRGRIESSSVSAAWYALAFSLMIWALGAFGNLWQEWILGRSNEMYRESMLAFNLAEVPIAFILASEWRGVSRVLARTTDALVALALGYGFFLYTWQVLTARGAPDEAGVHSLVWLLDAQNLFLTLGALVRWHAAEASTERNLFRALFIYEAAYLALIFYNNHYVAGDPATGPQESSIINLSFAVLGGLALWKSRRPEVFRPDPRLVRTVRSASPMLLAGMLLIVSLFVIRVDYTVGAAGILIAILGYTSRTTLAQVLYIERGEMLQRERSELQTIAWTDGLTGLANRHFLDQALEQVARRERPIGRYLSVLMIDIDFFKLLNDHYGHPAGDACLREVAKVLQQTAARPGDVLARYGGEEFIALIHDADAAGALIVAERIRSAVQGLRIENLGSPFGVVTVSIGAATALTDDTSAAAALVSAADSSLYEAKRAGRNQIRSLHPPGTAEETAVNPAS